ncbi:MAG TPA: recombinase family protein [Bryobacteraceae bacterium]|nr:recombinase family protein [Bryobacteraceae bacterium]
MPGTQRLRDTLTASPTLEYLNQMSASGWRLVALEWERESDQETQPDATQTVEVPYGMQISDDCVHLIENPAEMRVLVTAVNMIVEDYPMSRVAEELNRLGYRTRSAVKWTAAAVFDLLPRMIETGPRIFTKEEWVARRRRLMTD